MNQDGPGGLIRRAQGLREAARQWFIFYEELAHYFHYKRKGFLFDRQPGEELTEDIWNNYPETARRRLAEGYVAAACPKERVWPGVKPLREELLQIPYVRYWCEYVGNALHKIIYDPRCNFTEAMNELMDDTSSFGMGVMYIDHDKVNKHLTFQAFNLKDFVFEYDSAGAVTKQYCFWMLTIEDIVTKFGIDSLSSELQEEYKRPNCDYNKRYEVIHCIMPNAEYGRFGFAPGRLPYKSLWLMCKDQKVIGEGGYFKMPYTVVRWYRRTQEGRGRGPAEASLNDARLLQAVSGALLEITEKQGNPPMQGPIDILRGEIQMFAGGFTAFDASGFQFQGDPLRPVQLGANPAMTAEYLRAIENKIADAFFADAFSMPQRDSKMSPEDQAAQNQFAAAKLGPVFSRVENETLPPIMDRVFDFAMRGRIFPPTPPELSGEELIYAFDNMIADMREINEAQRALSGIGATAQFGEIPGAAEALDNIDWDIAFRDVWGKMKVPSMYIRSPEEMAQRRQQAQQQKQAAMMAEMLKAGGPGMKSAVEGAVQARDEGLMPAQ